jgi:mono/diheme cytochrome c family protein
MSPITWIGTCFNPADERHYIISYNDCCGGTACGRCGCHRNEGERPIVRPFENNEITWCFGTQSQSYSCSTARNLGVATKDGWPRMQRLLAALVFTGGAALALASVGMAVHAAPPGGGADVPSGVAHPDRAWQHWTLNCQGCHRQDGSGSPETTPPLAGSIARFTTVEGGREYLGRVPGVATAPLSDGDLAELLNWTLWRVDRAHLAADFRPYTAAELAELRRRPLRTEAAMVRSQLMRRLDRSHQHSEKAGHEAL